MKFGAFIVVVLCAVAPAIAVADNVDHQRVIEDYQREYGERADPHLLTLIANELRAAGKPRDALAYYCSYIYTAPAGDDADLASAQARAIQAELGRVVTSDREACTTTPASHAAPVARAVPGSGSTDVIATLPPLPPRISKREVAGIATLGVAIATLGVALYDGNQATALREQIDARDPKSPWTPELQAMADRSNNYTMRERLLLGAGGIAVVTGGVLYLTGRSARLKAERILLAPTVSKSGAGVVFGRSF